MTVAENSILRVVATLLWTDGNVLQNVYNCQPSGASPPYDDDDVTADCLDWIEQIYSNFTTAMSDEIDGSQIIVYKYDAVGDDWDEVASDNWVYDPSNTFDQTARGVAGLVNARTSDPDVNGKKYFGALCENNMDDGLWGAGQVAGLILAGGDWIGDFVGASSGATFNPGVWSVVEKAFFPMALTIIVPFIPAYQRRRKRGVGI